MIQLPGVREAGRRPRRMFFATASLALVCVVVLCISGCGGAKQTRSQVAERYGQELRGTVSSVVTDEQRRVQMLNIVDRMQALQLRFSRETADFIDSYRKLNADYEAKRPVFDQLFSDYGRKRALARDEALDLHFRLAALATAAEWDAIGRAEAKLYKKVNAAPAQPEQST